MDILCSLRNINLSFGDKPLFNEASLTIHQGEHIGLIGLNGKGKSTLFRILTEEIAPESSEPPFSFDKSKNEKEPQKAFSVFMVPQEMPEGEALESTVEDFVFYFYPQLKDIHLQLQEVNRLLEISSVSDTIGEHIEDQKELLEQFEFQGGWELTQNYKSYLKYFGIHQFEAKIKNLSGGEQKKVLLALGLSSQASLVLWDEPTNHLDIESIKLLEDELLGQNRAYILITHDRYLLAKTTNKIFHLLDGKISIFNGSYQEYLSFLDQEEEYRKKLLERLSNTLRREEAWMRQGIKARGCRSKKRVEGYHDIKSKVSNLRQQAKKELNLAIKESSKKSKKLITLKNASIAIEDNDLINDINLEVYKGNKIGLIGPNGCGKTSLIRAIVDDSNLCEGSIGRADNIVIQHFSQKRDELNESITPFDLLGEGEEFITLASGKKAHVIGYFESFLFHRDDINRPLSSFSGGERNRLQMAYNFTRAGDVWIFDEPTNDLDLETLKIVEEELAKFKGTLILISHDRAFLSAITDQIWLVRDRKIETFNAGYSQVESYLDALAIEQNLEDEEPIAPTPKKSNSNSKKLSNREKMRLNELQELIPSVENMITIIEQEILSFDFSNLDQIQSQNLKRLQHQKEEKEGELLALYEEQEELKTKTELN